MSLPPSVKTAYQKLDKQGKRNFKREYNAQAKSLLMGYVAWFCLAWHYLYLGRAGMQFAFWFTGGFLVIGWFVDALRLPGMINRHNADIARNIMAQHKMMAS